MKRGSHAKKSIEKRAKCLIPHPIKPLPKRKVKQEDDSCLEVDNDVKVEIHKEQIKLIARQEHECVAELGQSHNVT